MSTAWIPDATALADFRDCEAKFQQRHRLHLVRERSEDSAADAGAAWHEALKFWFSSAAHAHGPAPSMQEATMAALIAAWGEEPLFIGAPLKRPRGLYEALLRVYMEKWPREADAFEVVRNEEWCEGLIGIAAETGELCGCAMSGGEMGNHDVGPFHYGGRIDRAIKLDGHHYIMDSKTTSAYLSDAYFAQYAFSPQMLGYVALELVNGRDCEGAYIDAVHVDTRGQKATPVHCQRYGPIRYRQDQLSEWARNTEWRLRRIGELDAERGLDSRWPQNPNSCFKWNRACPYFERCCVGEEIAKTMPRYREEEWKPQR